MERSVCNRNCWISGAIVGVTVLLFTSGIGDLAWGAGVFLGLIVGVLFAALLVWLVCHEGQEPYDAGLDAPNNGKNTGMTGADWDREMAERQPDALLVSSGGPEGITSVAQLPIMAGAMPVAASEAEAEVLAGAADDLQRIKGIGPKLSVWLVQNGVTRFDQIAAWDAAEVADVARRLGRMGARIEADDWVGQARILASGGETEHSRRVARGEAT